MMGSDEDEIYSSTGERVWAFVRNRVSEQERFQVFEEFVAMYFGDSSTRRYGNKYDVVVWPWPEADQWTEKYAPAMVGAKERRIAYEKQRRKGPKIDYGQVIIVKGT